MKTNPQRQHEEKKIRIRIGGRDLLRSTSGSNLSDPVHWAGVLLDCVFARGSWLLPLAGAFVPGVCSLGLGIGVRQGSLLVN